MRLFRPPTAGARTHAKAHQRPTPAPRRPSLTQPLQQGPQIRRSRRETLGLETRSRVRVTVRILFDESHPYSWTMHRITTAVSTTFQNQWRRSLVATYPQAGWEPYPAAVEPMPRA